MVIFFLHKKNIRLLVFCLFMLCGIGLFHTGLHQPKLNWQPSLSESEAYGLIDDIFRVRNQVLLDPKLNGLQNIYDCTTRNGLWAYEHQVKKTNYLRKWCNKQGSRLVFARSLIRLRRVTPRREGLRATLLASTEYRYIYTNEPAIKNRMRIGTYHSLDLVLKDKTWKISREWYTDPFADALEESEAQTIADQLFIPVQPARDFSNLNPQRVKAIAYADEYCGAAADDERGFKYNPKYRNFNYSGGDCANFASQVLHEGGGLPKTRAWNYCKDASCAWVNAQAFNRFMLNNNRATRIGYGNYQQVLQISYKLLPGDYIAYEKKGKVTHISVVTGADSKGYTVMNSHNADRYHVPWDLGYGDKGIKFWLVRVHY